MYRLHVYRHTELIACIDEMGYQPLDEGHRNWPKLPMEFLMHPEKDVATLRHLYEYLLEKLAGTRKEDINVPHLMASQEVQYLQLHEESIPELAFWRAVLSLMQLCGVPDFDRSDITKPDARRVQIHLSALINFAKFKESKMSIYNEEKEKFNGVLETLKANREENVTLQQRGNQLRLQNADNREEIANLDEQIMAAQASHQEKNEEQANARHESGELKKEIAELKEQLKRQRLKFAEAEEEEKNLRGQVVQSPTRVRRAMEESQRTLQQERREGEEQEQAAQMSATAVLATEDAVNKINDTVRILQEILDESNTCIEIGQQMKASNEAYETHVKEAEKVDETARDLERKNRRLEEKLKNFWPTAELKKTEAARQNEESRVRLLELQRKRATAETQTSDEDREAEEIKRQIKEDTARHTVDMEALLVQWRRLQAVNSAQQSSLRQAMAAHMAEMAASSSATVDKENSANALPAVPSTPAAANTAATKQAVQALSARLAASTPRMPPPTPSDAAAVVSAAALSSTPFTSTAPLSTSSVRSLHP